MRAALLATALASACSRAPSPSPAPRQPGGAAAVPDQVTLERGPCFGSCPVYRVTLERTGAVAFEGIRFVADSGPARDSVPAARADSLFRDLEAGGWFDLAEGYTPADSTCGRYATDLPTVTTEVRLAGRTKRVRHDHGCQDAPAALGLLEHRIDEAAGVSRWVGR